MHSISPQMLLKHPNSKFTSGRSKYENSPKLFRLATNTGAYMTFSNVYASFQLHYSEGRTPLPILHQHDDQEA